MKTTINKIKAFMSEVQAELSKCTKPTKDELIGSTTVIVVSMLILGMFSFVVDLGFHYIINWMIH